MILCCGEALIDMIPNLDGAYVPHSGGSVFNTSIGIDRQGLPVGLVSGVSRDLFGDVLCTDFSQSNVVTDHLVLSDRPTTLAFVKLVDGKASYAFYDENTAGRMITGNDMPQNLPEDISALFFGGISLAVEPCADAYVDFLKRNASDHLIMADPNVRANFIADEARYRDRIDTVLGLSDVIKISDEDLDWIDPRDLPLSEKAQKLIQDGATYVCLTLGKDGVELHSSSGLIHKVETPRVKVVDTVGAGDAFNAGFLTSLYRADALSKNGLRAIAPSELYSALEFATKFASDTVTRACSDPAWNFKNPS